MAGRLLMLSTNDCTVPTALKQISQESTRNVCILAPWFSDVAEPRS